MTGRAAPDGRGSPEPLIASLAPFLRRAAALTTLGGDALTTARLAHALGDRLLASALLARSGGLYDHADRERLFAEPVDPALVSQARAACPKAPEPAGVSGTLEEVFVRVLAAYLLEDQPEVAPLPARWGAALPPGLWRLPAASQRERWALARQALGEQAPGEQTAAGQPGQPTPVTWAAPLVGQRWSAEQVLRAWGHADVNAPGSAAGVLSTEQTISALSAAWSWTLPPLVRLISRPLVLDSLHTLARDQLLVLSKLLDDAVRLFGWTVIGLPGLEREWPEEWTLLRSAVQTPPAEATRAAALPIPVAPLRPRVELGSVPELAQQVGRAEGHTLVMLSSRASAARLAGLLPGSHMLSSSLCSAHLFDRLDDLKRRREGGEVLRIVATTLPSTGLGDFDQVWHLTAPLPHLIEAAELARRSFHVVHLRDVAVPQDWHLRLEATESLLKRWADLHAPETQLEYDALTASSGAPGWRRAVSSAREQHDFATLAAELAARPRHSVPVVVPYGPGGLETAAQYRQTGRLDGEGLRYLAWLTPSEARRAVTHAQAEEGRWALIWTAPYDEQYGLAAELVRQTRQVEE